jgi:site-specific DNA recombinase
VLNLGQKDRAGIVSRVPAPEIEHVVKTAVLDAASAADIEATPLPTVHAWAKRIERIDVQADHLKIILKTDSDTYLRTQEEEPAEVRILTVPWSKPPMRRRRTIMVPDDTTLQQWPIRSEARSRLLKAIAQARLWLDQLVNDRHASITTIAKQQRLSDKRARSILSLAFLAPDIVEAAIEGRLHRGLTVTHMTDLPSDWREQRQALALI